MTVLEVNVKSQESFQIMMEEMEKMEARLSKEHVRTRNETPESSRAGGFMKKKNSRFEYGH